jgi:selenocysteine lyase/cysteine desulfurase
MEPLELSPFNRAGVRESEGVLEPLEELMPDAARFDMGERSNFITLPMMIASLELLLEIGVPTIQANSDRLNQRIAEGAARLGYHAPADRAPHLMGLRKPGGVGHAQNAALKQRGIHVSVRGDAYRISPHIYNDDSDVERLLAGLAALSAQAA